MTKKSQQKKLIKVLDKPATWIEVDKDFEVTEKWLAEKKAKYELKYPKFSQSEKYKARAESNEIRKAKHAGIDAVHLPYNIASKLHL